MGIRLLLLTAIFAVMPLCNAQSVRAGLSPEAPMQATPTSSAAKSNQTPDIIFFNAVIYTGEGFEQDKPKTVQAIAIGAGKVLAVGSDDEIKRMAGPGTQMRDLGGPGAGKFMFPGFNDAHTHLGMAGQTKMNLDLSGASSLDDMLQKIADYAKSEPRDHWITGGRWDQTQWAKKALPTRQELDKITAGHPAFLERVDGHIAIANSVALSAAGITGKTTPPEGGAIDHDTNGEPTGVLREGAMGLVERVIPPASHDERLRGDELAISDAVMNGVTSVQDFSDWDDFLIFEELERERKLSVRITEWLPFKEPLSAIKEMRDHHDANDPMLHTGMLKGFIDGSLGSRTAALKAPYSDDPGNTGLPQYTQQELNAMARERAQARFQLGFHAIGDAAVSMALNAFAQPGISTHARNRIEHAQVVDPADIPRFARLGVVASMQPCHLLTDMNWAEARLGPERAAYSYAWKAFLDAGVKLAFGTDYPVEPISPFRGLYAAVTRMNEAGTKTYFPEQRISRGQALYAYTQGSAYAEFAESRKGKLAPGYDADFILVDRDLYRAAAPDLLKSKVLETYVGGQQVYLSAVRIR